MCYQNFSTFFRISRNLLFYYCYGSVGTVISMCVRKVRGRFLEAGLCGGVRRRLGNCASFLCRIFHVKCGGSTYETQNRAQNKQKLGGSSGPGEPVSLPENHLISRYSTSHRTFRGPATILLARRRTFLGQSGRSSAKKWLAGAAPPRASRTSIQQHEQNKIH